MIAFASHRRPATSARATPTAALRSWRGRFRRFLAGAWLAGAGALAQAQSVWLDPQGQPSANIHAALQAMAAAADDGLSPDDYGVAALTARLRQIGPTVGPASNATSASALAQDVETAFERFVRELHSGRVDPRSLGFELPQSAAPAIDYLGLVRTVASQEQLPQLVARLRPALSVYQRLREHLPRYRALAADRSLTAVPSFAPARSVKPGDPYVGSEALHRLLVALGDLPASAPAPVAGVYDAALAEGVKRFQARHGLDADGALGRATWSELNVPPSQRVEQLELALERLRWLPLLNGTRFIGINIPMFRLWAWDPASPQPAPLEMGVVVGRALDTQTPVLSEEMRYLIFRPYWNVPRSIVRKELLPLIRRDPGYLDRHDMEIVQGETDNARPVPPTERNLALLSDGALRLRQRPGPKNSLGQVKFIFPNDDNVYLHDTPATQLFGRARRDFSHGCVRLERPQALAEWVLKGQPGWTRERIEAAMSGAPSYKVDLARPVPVILFYLTAMVLPSDGRLHFARDIYGHDAQLAQALARR